MRAIVHIEHCKGTTIRSMAHLLGVTWLVIGELGQVPSLSLRKWRLPRCFTTRSRTTGGAGRLADIAHNFGPEVARMVEGLSDTLAEEPSQKDPWEQRKQGYLDRLRNEPPEIQLISAPDKLYN